MISSDAPSPVSPRILVVGCGGIGGVVAANLLDQAYDVTALTTNTQIVDAINAQGFRVRGETSPGAVAGTAVREIPEGSRPFDFILLATQPTQVEEAARSVVAHLAPGGAMVCFQNGLCEERIAAIAGADRVIGGIVAWGATMVEPGVYDRTSAGGFVLGRLDGAPDPRVDELARILEAIGPTTTTSNLAGARWSKLAINCAISALGTVCGDRLGVVMRHRFIRRLALEIMTEAVEVARASGVRLEKVSGTIDLDWIALTAADRASSGSPTLVAKHTLLLAVGTRYRRLRSSMLAAIERGRPPAVDFLNGEIVARAASFGVATPINAAIRDEVMAIASGKVRPSLDRARGLYARTRAILAAPPPSAFPGVSPTLPDDEPPAAPKTVFEEPLSAAFGPPPTPRDPTLDPDDVVAIPDDPPAIHADPAQAPAEESPPHRLP